MTSSRPRRARFGAAQGFTLIELVVVIIILAVLAAVAVPRFTSMMLNNVYGRPRTSFVLGYQNGLIDSLVDAEEFTAVPGGWTLDGAPDPNHCVVGYTGC